MKILNKKGVDYLISYDGECGGKEYGEDLPEDLKCKKSYAERRTFESSTFAGKERNNI